MSFKSAVAFLLSLFAAGSAVPASKGELSDVALTAITTLKASKMGVDRAGNLWAWNAANGDLKLLAPNGEVAGRSKVSDALSVDADREWGVVGLVEVQRTIVWLREGLPDARIVLSGPAADICWVGPSTVAVSPQLAAHRIELWDLSQRKLVATLGSEVPLNPGVGATRLRTVLLRYDFERELLYSLESFTGALQVFRRSGELAWQAEAENPDRESWTSWLQDLDQRAKAERDSQTPTIFSLRLALTEDGAAWVAQKRLVGDEPVTLVKLSPTGKRSHELKAASCKSRDFVVWRDRVVLFRDPRAPQGGCVAVLKLP